MEIGKVTDVFKNYATIDDTAFVSSALFDETLKKDEEYEYEAIESDCSWCGRSYVWRVTRLIKKIECNEDRKRHSNSEVELHDVTITAKRDLMREVRNSVSVFNNSAQPVTLKSCKITSNSGLVKLERSELNFPLNQNAGKCHIYLKISPAKVGSFVEELIADFGSFQKKCFVTLDVHDNDRMMEYQKQKHSRREPRNVIPGQKVREAPRFVSIRIGDYSVPEEFREFDFKRRNDLVVHELKQEKPFLFDELSPSNYLQKMRHCLYMEEIAMEIQFAKYKIERGHFVNKDDYLRLMVEGVAEKRPSITIGDKIIVKERNQLNSAQPSYEGYIHKVEKDAILVKFHRDFHQKHEHKDYRIEFIFSRSTFKRQQHALDKTISQPGLGYEFIFPEIKNLIKNCQFDVKLGASGNMEYDDDQFPFFNKNLNNYQKEAVINVLRGETRPLPYIIYGPPGKFS